ncbi:hypothetical protein ACTFIU_002239 [Dictyostelium citrinum]
MNNSSTIANGNISVIKNRINGPLSLYDLEHFNENGYIIKNDIDLFSEQQQQQKSIIKDNIINESIIKLNQNFLNSFSQLFQITYSNSHKNNNINNSNIEYSDWPNLYNNFSPTDLIMNINNNDNNINNNNNNYNNNREKIISLDCNPFSLFKSEIVNKDKIIESVPLKKWRPINSILFIGDDSTASINLIPKYHKKSIQYICEKYSKEKRSLSKNLFRSINSTSELYKYDSNLISQFKEIPLKKGDLIYYDTRLPYCIISNYNNDKNNSNNNSFIKLSYLPNISINKNI